MINFPLVANNKDCRPIREGLRGTRVPINSTDYQKRLVRAPDHKNMLRKIFRKIVAGFIFLALGACEDSLMQKNPSTIDGKIFEDTGRDTGQDGPSDEEAAPGNIYPYPDIIEREFIPTVREFADTKCLAWRITWPSYDPDDGSDMIPTVWSRKTGALNSFDYLNATSPQNTYNGTMSLYYLNRLEAVNSLWTELDYSFSGFDNIEPIIFEKSDWTLPVIIDRVTSRPGLFESYWPGGGVSEIEYEEGDFFQFYMNTVDLYGGVRIVSLTPRIIEVYLAVPND
jgi:hypothetical protein